MAVLVVVLLNPLYLRSQRLVDRLFFRQRVDVQRSIENVSDAMIGLLDLRRIAELITQTIAELFHPSGRSSTWGRGPEGLREPGPGGYRRGGGPAGDRRRLAAGPGPRSRRQPLTQDPIEEDPGLEDLREGGLAAMDRPGRPWPCRSCSRAA